MDFRVIPSIAIRRSESPLVAVSGPLISTIIAVPERPLAGKADIQYESKSISAASKWAPNGHLGRIWSDGRWSETT